MLFISLFLLIFLIPLVVHSIHLVISSYLEKEAKKQAYNLYNEDMYFEIQKGKEELKQSQKLVEFVEGIEGVQSVTLSTKAYLELLRDKKELAELKEKVKEVLDDN